MNMNVKIVISDKIFSSIFFRWLTMTRPLSEFRIGGYSLREMLEKLGYRIFYNLSNIYLEKYLTKKFNLRPSSDINRGDVVYLNIGVTGSFGNINFLIKNILNYSGEKETVFYYNNDILAVYFPDGSSSVIEDIDLLKTKSVSINSNNIFLIKYPWEFSDISEEIIRDNVEYLLNYMNFDEYMKGVYIRGDVDISPRTNLNPASGPIIIDKARFIDSGSNIKGYTVIREDSYILGGKIDKSVIGPVSKVGAEISASIIDGYSNMQHHGYLGYSYIGEWVNIGAGTVFSDLKNTYGNIRIKWAGKRYDTGLIKVGSFVGDHAKTAINTTIFSGKMIGPFSHLYGLVYDNIPPFTIWNGYNRKLYELKLDKAIDIADRMYRRRGFKITKYEKELINHIFKATENDRLEHNVIKEKFIP